MKQCAVTFKRVDFKPAWNLTLPLKQLSSLWQTSFPLCAPVSPLAKWGYNSIYFIDYSEREDNHQKWLEQNFRLLWFLLLLSYKGERKRHNIFHSSSGLRANFEIGHYPTSFSTPLWSLPNVLVPLSPPVPYHHPCLPWPLPLSPSAPCSRITPPLCNRPIIASWCQRSQPPVRKKGLIH